MGCKNYYKLFNESCILEPTGVKKWKEKFPDEFVDWSHKFLHIYQSSKDNRDNFLSNFFIEQSQQKRTQQIPFGK